MSRHWRSTPRIICPRCITIRCATPGTGCVRRRDSRKQLNDGDNAMRPLLSTILLTAGIIGLISPSAAKVVKFEVVRVESPAFEGRNFGTVGTYDRIIARAT